MISDRYIVRLLFCGSNIDASKLAVYEKYKTEIAAIENYAVHYAEKIKYSAEPGRYNDIEYLLRCKGFVLPIIAEDKNHFGGEHYKNLKHCTPQQLDSEDNVIDRSLSKDFIEYCNNCQNDRLKRALNSVKDKILKGEIIVYFNNITPMQ